MTAILSQAQALVSQLQTLMPSLYQQDSLQALLGLFLEGQGIPLPERTTVVLSKRDTISQIVSTILKAYQLVTKPSRERYNKPFSF